jgi:hypothetical protein
MTSSFISNTDGPDPLNNSRHSFTNMQQYQYIQVHDQMVVSNNKTKNKHYSTSQALHGQTSYPILAENQHTYRNNILRNKLAL